MTNSKFIVIEHSAKRAGKHYDIRFQIPKLNMWASFACRKEIPIKPGVKILAVRTHDHSQKEALFTGKIESGYGAGTLKKWDGGSCDIIKYSTSHISIDFKGSKLKGIYHFVNTGVIDKKSKGGKSYILFKGRVS